MKVDDSDKKLNHHMSIGWLRGNIFTVYVAQSGQYFLFPEVKLERFWCINENKFSQA